MPCLSLNYLWCKNTPGLEVLKLELILRLKIKRNDWLLVDTCPQAANLFILSLRLYSCFITSRHVQYKEEEQQEQEEQK